jgi:hypothetical protein
MVLLAVIIQVMIDGTRDVLAGICGRRIEKHVAKWIKLHKMKGR